MPSLLFSLTASAAAAAAGLTGSSFCDARTIFPKPLSQVDDAAHTFIPINARDFQFKTAAGSPTNDILQNAFNRYYTIAIGQSGAAAAFESSNFDSSTAGDEPITGLEVTIDTADDTLTLETNVSYTLQVQSPTVTISAPNVFGALNGLESFSQLVGSDSTINGTTVHDNPRYQFRSTSE